MAKLTSTNISDSMSYVGPVGIGIAVPVSLLDVSKSAPAADVEIYIQNSAAAGTSDGAVLRLIPSSNVGAGVKLISDRGARAGTSAAQGSLYISATDGLTESIKMTVRGDTGNVGIGTTSPDQLLILNRSNSAGDSALSILNSSLSNGSYEQIYLGKSYGTHGLGTISYVPSATSASSTLRLGLWGSSDSLVIDGNRNVGIGTTSPTSGYGVLQFTGGQTGSFISTTDAGMSLANFNGEAYIVSRATVSSAGVWTARGTSAATISVRPSGFVFTANASLTAGNSFSPTERMSISNAGVVTIPNLGGTASRNVVADANGVLSAPTSDRRLKKNDEPLPYGLSEVNKMNPIRFNWIPENMSTDKEIGFIAQEMETIIPEIIGANIDGMKTIGYDKLVAVLCKAVQELSAKNDALEERLSAIEKN